VYPAASGTVRLAQEITGGGYAVIIEHRTPGAERFTTVYFHLRPPKAGGVPIRAGDEVASLTQPIGVVSDRPEDHGYTRPHLHFGIRAGPYQAGIDPRTGKWFYPGYTTVFRSGRRECDRKDAVHDEILAEWKHPRKFVKDFSPSACVATEPGTELTCSDGLDNDCDGPADGDDLDCLPDLKTIEIDFESTPGPDGKLGTADDVATPACPLICGGAVPLDAFAVTGVTLTAMPLFYDPGFYAPFDAHYVSGGMAGTFSVPVYEVALDAYSSWSIQLDAFDDADNLIAGTTRVHPNPGSGPQFSTVRVTSQAPIESFAAFAVDPDGPGGSGPIANLDHLRFARAASSCPAGAGAPCETGQLGVCAAGTKTCVDGDLACIPGTVASEEICENGANDDCDEFEDDCDEASCANGASCGTFPCEQDGWFCCRRPARLPDVESTSSCAFEWHMMQPSAAACAAFSEICTDDLGGWFFPGRCPDPLCNAPTGCCDDCNGVGGLTGTIGLFGSTEEEVQAYCSIESMCYTPGRCVDP
jgi:hypothetical protein